jgi:hypothetical protein
MNKISKMVLIGMVLSTSVQAQSPVEVSCDKIRGYCTSSVRFEYLNNSEDPSLKLHTFAVRSEDLTSRLSEAVRPVTMMFVSSGSSWRYLHYNDVKFLLNDTTRLDPREEHDGRVNDGVLEFITVRLTMDQFKKIAEANTVVGVIGGTTFNLTTEQVAQLKSLAAHLQQTDSNKK